MASNISQVAFRAVIDNEVSGQQSKANKLSFTNISLKIISIALCALCSLSQGSEPENSNQVIDIVAKKGFIEVSDSYSFDGNLIFCVQLKNGTWAFWSPKYDSLETSDKTECVVKYRKPNTPMKSVELLRVHPETFEAFDAFDKNSGAITIANNGRIFRNEDSTCHTNFDSYYEIRTTDQQNAKFYLVFKSAIASKKYYRCDAFERELEEEYYVRSINATYLDDKTFLTSARDARGGVKPPLLLLGRLPKQGWTNHSDIYIIPYDELHERLIKLNSYDPVIRYKEVLSVIKKMDK